MTNKSPEKSSKNTIDGDIKNYLDYFKRLDDTAKHKKGIEKESFEQDGFAKNKVLVAIGGLVLTLMVIGGSIWASKADKGSELNNDPSQPPIEEQQTKTPKEAREFVEQYGDRYNDPVSTYYADKAYAEANSGKSLIITDEYIKNYIPPEYKYKFEPVPDVSDHGFTYHKLPKSIDLSGHNTNAGVVFKSYYAPSLSLYMNLVAKNPSTAAREIVDREFKDYCSSVRDFDDEYVDRLMVFGKNVADTYGSSVNYDIAPLNGELSKAKDPDVSFMFPGPIGTSWQPEYYPGVKTKAVGIAVDRLVINLTNYSGSQSTTTKATAYNFQANFLRQPTNDSDETTPISIGLGQIPELYP